MIAFNGGAVWRRSFFNKSCFHLVFRIFIVVDCMWPIDHYSRGVMLSIMVLCMRCYSCIPHNLHKYKVVARWITVLIRMFRRT